MRNSKIMAVALPMILLSACGGERAPATSYEGTVGQLGADLVLNAYGKVSDDYLKNAMSSALVLNGKDALALLENWPEHKIVADARAILQLPGAIAITLPKQGDESFLFVPRPAGGEGLGLGFVLGEDDPEECIECYEHGERGGQCTCQWTCYQVVCPANDWGSCGSCPSNLESWSFDDPWTDPIPIQFQTVRNLFGPDGRFACKSKVSNLAPGELLFETCQA